MKRFLVILVLVVLGGWAQAQTTYYVGASTSGSADCTSESDRCLMATAITSLSANDTISAASGTYQGANSMITISSLNASSGNEVTISCESEGDCKIDGQDARVPVSISGSSYIDIAGFNFYESNDNVVDVGSSSSHIRFYRCVAYNADPDANDAVWGMYGDNILCEDCVGFGTGRKTYALINGSTHTYRRCFGRWEYSTRTDPKVTFELTYENGGEGGDNSIWENCIGTWDRQAGSNTSQLYGVFGPGGATGVDDSSLYGNLAYRLNSQTNDSYTYWMVRNDNWHFEDNVAYLGDSVPTGIYSWYLVPDSAPAGYTHTSNMTVRDGHNQTFSARVTVTDHTDITHSGDLTVFYDHLCYRYVDGSLTADPLWPWPMNQRIIDAMTDAGYTGDDIVDVGSVVETLFGSIPGACDSTVGDLGSATGAIQLGEPF